MANRELPNAREADRRDTVEAGDCLDLAEAWLHGDGVTAFQAVSALRKEVIRLRSESSDEREALKRHEEERDG